MYFLERLLFSEFLEGRKLIGIITRVRRRTLADENHKKSRLVDGVYKTFKKHGRTDLFENTFNLKYTSSNWGQGTYTDTRALTQ